MSYPPDLVCLCRLFRDGQDTSVLLAAMLTDMGYKHVGILHFLGSHDKLGCLPGRKFDCSVTRSVLDPLSTSDILEVLEIEAARVHEL